MKKVICLLSIISLIAFITIFIILLPIIYRCKWQGTFFIITVMLFLANLLYQLFKNPNCLKKSVSYNLLFVATTLYYFIIYIRIRETENITSSIYLINTDYCKNNFIILGIVLILLILNFNILTTDSKKKL